MYISTAWLSAGKDLTVLFKFASASFKQEQWVGALTHPFFCGELALDALQCTLEILSPFCSGIPSEVPLSARRRPSGSHHAPFTSSADSRDVVRGKGLYGQLVFYALAVLSLSNVTVMFFAAKLVGEKQFYSIDSFFQSYRR